MLIHISIGIGIGIGIAENTGKASYRRHNELGIESNKELRKPTKMLSLIPFYVARKPIN